MKLKMKNETYDIMKYIAMIVLPALATLVIALGDIWAIPYTAQISATIVAFDTFMGGVLHVSTKNYNNEIDDEVEE